mmetsp:Transcript_7573/g.12381  ORF Transcript_7573/g.12381 Transcript_7573/m.12381 type:complete len:206 (+) Transcript_7573:58-675(+)
MQEVSWWRSGNRFAFCMLSFFQWMFDIVRILKTAARRVNVHRRGIVPIVHILVIAAKHILVVDVFNMAVLFVIGKDYILFWLACNHNGKTNRFQRSQQFAVVVVVILSVVHLLDINIDRNEHFILNAILVDKQMAKLLLILHIAHSLRSFVDKQLRYIELEGVVLGRGLELCRRCLSQSETERLGLAMLLYFSWTADDRLCMHWK